MCVASGMQACVQQRGDCVYVKKFKQSFILLLVCSVVGFIGCLPM